MSQRGSLINHLAANNKHEFKVPQVGDGVTFYSWTDRHAGTVVATYIDKHCIIEIKHDKATRTDKNGMSESQTYTYETNFEGRSCFYKWDVKKSQWVGVEKNEKGRWILNRAQTISIGSRMAYHDFSF